MIAATIQGILLGLSTGFFTWANARQEYYFLAVFSWELQFTLFCCSLWAAW